MTDPKTKLRGQTDLGKAIDERIASRAGKLDMRHGTGDALPAPISGGGSIGGSPGGGDPAFPESYVESLKKNGEADALSGNIVLDEDGTAVITQSASAPHFVLRATAALSVASLPGTGDQELLYLRTSDNTLWRDKDGAGGWEEIGGSTAGPEFPDDTFRVYDNADNTKKLAFEVSGVTTGTTRTFTVPDENGWIGLFRLNGSSVLINTLGRVLDLPANVGGGWAMRTWESGDASQRFAITSSGLLQWNDGAGGGFVHLFRGATGRLDMDDGEWLRLREYLEQEEITTPANPDTGYVRTYAKAGPVAGSRHYLKDDDGNEHDLSVAHKQTFWCAQDDDESSEINVPWGYTNYPSGASIATVTPASQVAITYAMGVGAALLPDAYAHFEWASVAIPSFGVTDGSQVVLAVPVRKHGDTVTVRARVRVNNVQYLDKVYFSVNDSASTSGGSINVLGSMSNNTWYEAVLADVDVSSLTDFMRIVVTAQGTTNDAAGFSGATEFDVEYITIEQWFK